MGRSREGGEEQQQRLNITNVLGTYINTYFVKLNYGCPNNAQDFEPTFDT